MSVKYVKNKVVYSFTNDQVVWTGFVAGRQSSTDKREDGFVVADDDIASSINGSICRSRTGHDLKIQVGQ